MGAERATCSVCPHGAPRTHLLLPLLWFGHKDTELDLRDLRASVVLTEAQGGAEPLGNHRDSGRYCCKCRSRSGACGAGLRAG